jgi:hypothetical protein
VRYAWERLHDKPGEGFWMKVFVFEIKEARALIRPYFRREKAIL